MNELLAFLRRKKIQYFEVITDHFDGPHRCVFINVMPGIRMPEEGFFKIAR